MRKPIPKPYNGGTWSHARMMSFLRSGLRRMSMRWNPMRQCMMDARKPYTGSNKRRRWMYQCARCREWWPGSDVRAHHKEACGELRCFDDLPRFAQRLFCEADGFECLCGSCHASEHGKGE